MNEVARLKGKKLRNANYAWCRSLGLEVVLARYLMFRSHDYVRGVLFEVDSEERERVFNHIRQQAQVYTERSERKRMSPEALPIRRARRAHLRAMHLDQFRARATLKHAVRTGRVTREPCQVCGDAKSEGHHDDYSKPLDVEWLCRRHHVEVERNTIQRAGVTP